MQPEVPIAEGQRPAAQSRAPRPLKPLTDRLLIIGLDGATFDVLDPLMDAGPHAEPASASSSSGTSGVLHSTQPPITPAAWTTFMTGKGPGRHGILDFEKYDVAPAQLDVQQHLSRSARRRSGSSSARRACASAASTCR